MTVIVNPEGYVFTQLPDGRLRIKDASVSLYWLDPDTVKYELWPAEKFLQKNPVKTDETGKYSFLVPQGMYYLKVESLGYSTYLGAPFSIKENNIIRESIELKKSSWLPVWLNWQMVIALLLFLIVIMMAVVIIFFLINKNKGR